MSHQHVLLAYAVELSVTADVCHALQKQSSPGRAVHVTLVDAVGIGAGGSGAAAGLLHPFSPKGKVGLPTSCWVNRIILNSTSNGSIMQLAVDIRKQHMLQALAGASKLRRTSA
jgi:glycine/D-amino acid oxidase-like deaminating enzyme